MLRKTYKLILKNRLKVELGKIFTNSKSIQTSIQLNVIKLGNYIVEDRQLFWGFVEILLQKLPYLIAVRIIWSPHYTAVSEVRCFSRNADKHKNEDPPS